VIRRQVPPIARPAPSGANSGSTKAYALGMRRRQRHIPKKPPTGLRPTVGSGAATASPPSRSRSARTAQTASIGAIPRADSIRSTAATCPWRGGRMPESAPAMRLTRFRSQDREPSGARRRIGTFAARASRAVQMSDHRPRRRHSRRRGRRRGFCFGPKAPVSPRPGPKPTQAANSSYCSDASTTIAGKSSKSGR